MDSNLSSRCLSLDLEVGKQDRRIHAFAAVRPNVDQPLVFQEGDLAGASPGKLTACAGALLFARC